MEKFDLLIRVLRDLQTAGVLRHCTLVGSWCLEFYRKKFNNAPQIPAVRTLDADILLPRRVNISPSVSVCAILEKNGFVTDIEYATGLFKFRHPELDIEFLTDPGSKPTEDIRFYKDLGISAQELRFMSIPLRYHTSVEHEGLLLKIPEPEAFALHKLIIVPRRKNPEKAIKDLETVQGLFAFFEGKPLHVQRLNEIYNDFFKGWQQKVNESMKAHRVEFPSA